MNLLKNISYEMTAPARVSVKINVSILLIYKKI